MSDPVLLNRQDGIATITLNQPDHLNALSKELQLAFLETLNDLRSSEDPLRCLVVEGAGDAFSAGGDIEAMKERFESDATPDMAVQYLEETTNELMARLVRFPAPTVAKVNGPAVGAGANVAIACDVQLAREDATIGFVFRKVGLAIDAGTSYLLPRLVGLNTAKELVYTGEFVEPQRALDLGLYNHVYETDSYEDDCKEFIDRIASGPTVALRHSKRLLESGLQKSLEEALQDEVANQGMIFETEDHREGVDAFLEDRSPDYRGK
ncbi:MAG: enoyl-CoA hydratase/isomerase family protein [bacterium]